MTSNTRTLGISPKLVCAVLGAIIAYLITQELVDFPAYVDLIIQVAGVALGAFIAGPGTVAGVNRPSPPPGG